jgi:6-phosphogluconate dehydrogenase (decarboxylating)
MWTVETGKELGIPTPFVRAALDFRLQSRDNPSYTGKLIAAMQNRVGGHETDENK